MNIIKLALGALAGVMAATFICWGTLVFYAQFVLRGKGSLFDTNPDLAESFFFAWGVVSMVCMLVGASMALRKTSGKVR